MALSKIQSGSLNLADDYAFTGTVTGIDSGMAWQTPVTMPTDTNTFTLSGIPSTAKNVSILWYNVQHTGSVWVGMKVGTSGGLKSTGYQGGVVYTSGGTFYSNTPNSPGTTYQALTYFAAKYNGRIDFAKLDGNNWQYNWQISVADGGTALQNMGSGAVTSLDAELSQVNFFTTSNWANAGKMVLGYF
jgi:hypothetical protein